MEHGPIVLRLVHLALTQLRPEEKPLMNQTGHPYWRGLPTSALITARDEYKAKMPTELADIITKLDDEITKRTIPHAGDVIEVTNDNYYASNAKTGARAIITSSEGWIDTDEIMMCFGASAFRDGDYVSCSGGPLPVVKAADLTYAGPTTQTFWRWKDRPRAGGGENYDLEVSRWLWAPKAHS